MVLDGDLVEQPSCAAHPPTPSPLPRLERLKHRESSLHERHLQRQPPGDRDNTTPGRHHLQCGADTLERVRTRMPDVAPPSPPAGATSFTDWSAPEDDPTQVRATCPPSGCRAVAAPTLRPARFPSCSRGVIHRPQKGASGARAAARWGPDQSDLLKAYRAIFHAPSTRSKTQSSRLTSGTV